MEKLTNYLIFKDLGENNGNHLPATITICIFHFISSELFLQPELSLKNILRLLVLSLFIFFFFFFWGGGGGGGGSSYYFQWILPITSIIVEPNPIN